jgi:hypothetical protein
MKFLRVPLAALLLAGCGLLEPDSEEQQEFNDALAAWKRQGIEDYYYVHQRSCECVVEWTRAARVVVRSGRVVEATDLENGVTRNLEYYLTIDGLFALIKQAFDEHADRVEVVYDRSMHYPVSVFIDQDRNVADDEYTLQVSSLTKIPW